MSMVDNRDGQQADGGLVTQCYNLNLNVAKLTTTLMALFPQVRGTFTLAAAATTTVTQPAVKANSLILLMPTNASAATLMGSAKSLFVTITAGTSFTLNTASAAAAAGTETFAYVVF